MKNFPLKKKDVKNILLLELWGIGDVVLATSAIIALKEIFPDARLTVLAKPYAREVLKHCPYIDSVITFNFPWTKLHGKYNLLSWNYREMFFLFNRLRGNFFDLVIDVRNDPRSNLVMFLAGAKQRIGYGGRGGGFLLTHDVPSENNKSLHRVEEWLKLLRYCDEAVNVANPTLWLAKAEVEAAWRNLEAAGVDRYGDGLIMGIHVGASNPSKKWPLDRFQQLGEDLMSKLGVKVIFFTDPDGYGKDIKVDDAVMAESGSLRELMGLIRCCDVFVCNDGGPMHIAAALDVPTVAVFGPTLSFWFGPYGDNHRVVEKDVCRYKPCSDYCRYDQPRCLYEIGIKDVLQPVEELLVSIRASKNVVTNTTN